VSRYSAGVRPSDPECPPGAPDLSSAGSQASDHRTPFSIILVGHQIADSARWSDVSITALSVRR